MVTFLRRQGVAVLALLVALTSTAHAAGLPVASVGTRQLVKAAVTTAKLKNGAVTAGKLKNGAVTSAKLRNGAVTAGKIGPGAVTGTSVRDGSIGRADLAPLAVGFVDGGLGAQGNTSPPSPASGTSAGSRSVTVPRSGPVYVRYFSPFLGGDCSAGTARAGLYWDDVPVEGAAVGVPSQAGASAREISGVVASDPGPHTASVRVFCTSPGATLTVSQNIFPSWTFIQP